MDYISRNLPMVKAYKAQGPYLMWLDMTALAEKLNTKQMAGSAVIGALGALLAGGAKHQGRDPRTGSRALVVLPCCVPNS